jgi:putative FmdB family regulatory protein
MPIYEYKCEREHIFDVMQRMSDDPLEACQVCGAPVKRVFHPVAVHFKGSGFYNTDYGTRKRSREAKESGSDDTKPKSDSTSSSSSKSTSESKKSESSTASSAASSD